MVGGRVVVISQDANLVGEVTRTVGGANEMAAVASLDQAATRPGDSQSDVFLVDMSAAAHAASAGDGPCRLSEWLRTLDRDACVLAITPDSGAGTRLPAAWVDANNVTEVRRAAMTEQLGRILRQYRPANGDRNGSAALPSRTLRGRSRSFTTYTPELFRMLDELELVASYDVSMLLIGETGSGKTYLSQLIHELSPRHNERFLPVACGTLPPDLIESELFGHVKGAFTGAHAEKNGKFAAAGRGTLLLDEIDVLGLDQQAKLLRVLETGEYEPVGCNTTQTSQARLIVASNQDLEPLVQENRFRRDLYYRLNVLSFHLPPLRQRLLDLLPLAKQFIHLFAQTHGIAIHEIAPEFYHAIQAYPWPGNIRELENAIRRAIILCRNGVLTLDGLPATIVQSFRDKPSSPSNGNGSANDETLDHFVARTEREAIEDALRRNKFKRTAAAKLLGISRVTLYNKMRKYGMMPVRKPVEYAPVDAG